MTDDLFHGPKLKIKRANQHIGELQHAFQHFLATTKHGFVINKHAGQFSVAAITQDLPCEIPTIIGDVVHNLRACLDHLACVLVELNNGTVTDETYFPFGKTRNDFESNVARMMKGASPEAIKLVKDMQVHAEEGGDKTLWALNRLDRADKHRALIPAIYVSVLRNVRTFRADGSVDNTIGEVRMSGPTGHIEHFMLSGDKFETDKEATFDIFFKNVEVFKGEPVIPTLTNLSQIVSKILEVCETRLIHGGTP